MKILIQSIYFWPEIGGLENHVYNLARGLAQRGHEVMVLTSRSQSKFAKREKVAGVEVIRVWCPKKSPLGWILTSFASIPKFLQLAPNYDIWHAQTHPSALGGIIAKLFWKRRFLLTVHTSHFLKLAKKWWYRPILRFILSKPDLVLAASEEIRDVCQSLTKNEVLAIVNCVDTDYFTPEGAKANLNGSGDAVTLLCPRRLVWKNGVAVAVKAMKLVTEKVKAQFYIVGDGPERGNLENLRRELGLEKTVHFLGPVTNDRMPEMLRASDVVVIPSFLEATSVACLEAMACAKPVVASDTGGLPTLINDRVGRIFHTGDEKDLAEKLVSLINSKKGKELGQEGRKIVVENWSLRHFTTRHVQYYEGKL